MITGKSTTSEKARGSGSTPSRTLSTPSPPPQPPPPPHPRRHHKHLAREVRLIPCSLVMPKNWHASDRCCHTQAGATPPQSQECHAVEHARTTPATHRLQGIEHHLHEEFVIDVHENGARDVRLRGPGQGIMFVASLCTRVPRATVTSGRFLACPSGANLTGTKPLHHDTVAGPRRGVVVEWLHYSKRIIIDKGLT